MDVTFFKNQAAFRKWLTKNHDKVKELWIGFYKKHSGKPSITYREALDEALCFGWIDGVRKRVDDDSYKQRFTPRRARSIWSNINIKRVEELKKLGRMHESGKRVFEQRDPKRSGIYSFENEELKLDPSYEKMFRKNKKAWEFFEKQPPYLKKTLVYYIMSAKKEETRLRRLQYLMDSSAKGQRVGVLTTKSDDVR